MKEFLRAKIFALSQYLEMLLSLILGLVIVILAGKLLMDVFNPQYFCRRRRLCILSGNCNESCDWCGAY